MAGYFHEDEVLGKAYDAKLMRRLSSYLGPYRGLLALSVALIVGMSFAQIAPALLQKFIIDESIGPAVARRIGVEEGISRLLPLGLLYVGVLLGTAAIRYGQNVLTAYVGQRAMYDLRVALFRHVEWLSLTFFDRNPVGRLMTRLTNDIDALIDMVQRGVVSIISDLFMLVVVAGAMALLDWRLTLVTFVSMPIVVLLTGYFRRVMRESFRAIRIRLARINAYLNENITGMSVVQLFARERAAFRQFDDLNRDLLVANRGQIRVMSAFHPSITLTRQVTSALLFGIGALLIQNGELTLGTLLAFWQLVDRFFFPIQDLAEKYNILQAAMASSERIFRLMDTAATIKEPAHPVHLEHVRGEIAFDHVWFAYNSGRADAPTEAAADGRGGPDWVLRDVDIRIGAGESVAIVGATGAGKTSIISLISRFYDVQRGTIRLDGVDLRDMLQADVRRHVGVVLQDPFIFAGTIASNIRLGDPGIDDERVRAAARFVNAEAFIQKLPQGYDTPVTERGSTLSVGQKQLLAFARAIAFNPEILLVLDEATSSVDTETERLIQDALAKLMIGRTSIIIAHRLSTIQNVDRIIVLHKGRVAEAGTHRELLAERGVYHRLYELQYRAAEVAGA